MLYFKRVKGIGSVITDGIFAWVLKKINLKEKEAKKLLKGSHNIAKSYLSGLAYNEDGAYIRIKNDPIKIERELRYERGIKVGRPRKEDDSLWPC